MTVKELREKLAEMNDTDEVIVHLDNSSSKGGSRFFELWELGLRPMRPGLLPYGDGKYPTDYLGSTTWGILWIRDL